MSIIQRSANGYGDTVQLRHGGYMNAMAASGGNSNGRRLWP